MNILINKKEIDFKLGHERTAWEIISEIYSFLNKENLFIVELKVDSKPFFVYDPELKDMDVNLISSMEFQVKGRMEDTEEKNELLYEYLNVLRNSLLEFEEKGDIALPTLESNLKDFKVALPLISGILEDGDDINFKDIENKIQECENASFKSYISPLKDVLANGIKVVNSRIAECIQPIDKLRETIAELKNETAFQDIPDLLQSGDEDKAGKEIYLLSKIFSKIYRLYKYSSWMGFDNRLFNEDITKLTDKLTDFKDALGKADHVFVADLIEYEIYPIIEDMDGHLK